MSTKTEVALATPPTTVILYKYVLGLTMQDWIGILSIILLLLQIGHRLWVWHRDAKKRIEDEE